MQELWTDNFLCVRLSKFCAAHPNGRQTARVTVCVVVLQEGGNGGYNLNYLNFNHYRRDYHCYHHQHHSVIKTSRGSWIFTSRDPFNLPSSHLFNGLVFVVTGISFDFATLYSHHCHGCQGNSLPATSTS